MMGGRHSLQVQSVLLIDSYQNFYPFFGVLFAFDCVVSGIMLRKKEAPPKKHDSKLQHLIRRCLGEMDDEESTFPDFVYRTFECFRDNKTEIVLKLRWMISQCDLTVFHDPILHSVAVREWSDEEDTVNTIKWDQLFAIFPNVRTVTVKCADRSLPSECGFSLSSFVQRVCETVFPQHRFLEVVAVDGVDEGAMSHKEKDIEEMVNGAGLKVSIENDDVDVISKFRGDDDKTKNFSIMRV